MESNVQHRTMITLMHNGVLIGVIKALETAEITIEPQIAELSEDGVIEIRKALITSAAFSMESTVVQQARQHGKSEMFTEMLELPKEVKPTCATIAPAARVSKRDKYKSNYPRKY